MDKFEHKLQELINEIHDLSNKIDKTNNYYVDESFLVEKLQEVIKSMKNMLIEGKNYVSSK